MISKPRTSNSLDILYELEFFLENHDQIKGFSITDDLLQNFSLDELQIENSKFKNV